MKKYLLMFMAAGMAVSCNQNSTSADHGNGMTVDSTEQTAKFGGVFTGTTPCADCPGIYTVAAFRPDGTFGENLTYFDRNTRYADSGKWIIKDSLITVVSGKDSSQRYFQRINDSTLRMLDAEKMPITGQLEQFYILKKKDTVLQR